MMSRRPTAFRLAHHSSLITHHPSLVTVFPGAHDADRTRDLVLTKDVLYQLSYVGAFR
ncbi:hypothetical protein NITMOv2_1189 [Nitrospira moscoviensis]|uniref:Uncharacterized protein n=1 Tax=Nitrospira moscoviensis TaxID=42253 RepID=A0A0K2G9I8_NITMO|nr:hypothetical protein NITMOv2_1189 [Nitrospira moscoviensis]